MEYYETVQGDTFDLIAKKVYGAENQVKALFEMNPVYMGVVIFPAGVTLRIPQKTAFKAQTTSTFPAWRKP